MRLVSETTPEDAHQAAKRLIETLPPKAVSYVSCGMEDLTNGGVTYTLVISFTPGSDVPDLDKEFEGYPIRLADSTYFSLLAR